ncbi:MAG TPA: hypothetical protein VGO86_04750 [Candidatus Dormibacteraeota bacterium]
MGDELPRLRAALLEEAPEPDAALEARILANRGEPVPRWRRPAALAAGLLAATLVVGLLAAGHRLPVPGARNEAVLGAGAPPLARPTATPVPTPPVPRQEPASAHLENVAQLIQPLHVTADSGGQTVELFGVYSDSVRTVFLVHGLPGGGVTDFSVGDQQGVVNASTSSAPAGPTDRFFSLNAPLHAGPDGTAQATLDLQQYPQGASGPMSPTARWTFQATVRVGAGKALAVPAPVTVGGWTWQLTTIEETPNAIEVVAIVHGATVDQVSGPSVYRPLTLVGPGGASAPVLFEGASVTVPKQQLNATTAQTTRVQAIWLRGADGAYQLTIHTRTGEQVIPVTVG